LVAALYLHAGRKLSGVERLHRGLAENTTRGAHALHPFASVFGGREVIEAQGRLVERVGRLDADGSARVGVHRAYVDLISVAGRRRAAVVADREGKEVEHNVGIRDLVIAANETATLKVVARARAGAVE